MLTRKQYNIIKDGILDLNYKRVRLIRLSGEGERELMTTYNSYIKGGEENAVKRLDYIKHQLDKILPPGNYVIEAATTPTGNQGIVDSFHIKKLPVNIPINQEGALQENIEDHSQHQENMAEFDIDEYKDLINKIAECKTIIKVQDLTIEDLKRRLAEKEQSLSDAPGANGIVKLIEEHAPVALSIFDKFLSQRDKQFELKDRELSLAENGHSGKRKKIVQRTKEKSREEILADMEDLYDKDEEAFNATLSEMGEKNPELYDYISDSMFEEGEEEEEDSDDQN